jgi:mevalonate kinase
LIQKFYSNGKLLLTGEYVVLNGAEALAIPTRYGQSLSLATIERPKIVWESLDEKGFVWLKEDFSLDEITKIVIFKNKNEFKNRLIQILREAKKLNPKFLSTLSGYKITTKLDFPRDWGLGSSSTLINNIANWAEVDAYKLLANTFRGSGYDIAAAQHDCPILFSLKEGAPVTKEIDIPWNFTDRLFFVYLNKKQNSREGIKQYHSKPKINAELISEISLLTSKIINSTSLIDFENLITAHEEIISKIIEQDSVKKIFFQDYSGSIKSLGAWGGDFILVTGDEMKMDYFRKKGYKTIIPFDEMIK